MRPVLIVRPEPGAAATLARATAAGLQAIAAPIFTIVAIPWEAPDPALHDALMLTSANAVRHAGSQLDSYRGLPVYAVGESTARAATSAGFGDIRTGSSDAVALTVLMQGDGVTRALHLAGREHRALDQAHPVITRRVVYASDRVATLPASALAALDRGAVALIHSPRAATIFATLLREAGIDPATIAIAAISPAAANGGWKDTVIAASPDDSALLAAAHRLCEKG